MMRAGLEKLIINFVWPYFFTRHLSEELCFNLLWLLESISLDHEVIKARLWRPDQPEVFMDQPISRENLVRYMQEVFMDTLIENPVLTTTPDRQQARLVIPK